MMVLVFMGFNPAARFAVGDFGDVPEIVVGLDLNKERWTFSLELGRIISNRITDSSTVSTMAEGGADTTGGTGDITAYNFIFTLGVRYALLDVKGKRFYLAGGLGFQRPQMNLESYPVIGDDFTYMAGAGGDILLGTLLEGDFWNRTRFWR